MSSTENLRQIREALQNHPDIDFPMDWNNPYEVWELLAGDGEGGESIAYTLGDHSGDLHFTKTWGMWILSDIYTAGESNPGAEFSEIWHQHYTIYPTKAAAKAAYIAAIEAKRAEGATWEPDYCPIFDRVEATWK